MSWTPFRSALDAVKVGIVSSRESSIELWKCNTEREWMVDCKAKEDIIVDEDL